MVDTPGGCAAIFCQAGEVDRKEPHEVEQRETRSPARGEEEPRVSISTGRVEASWLESSSAEKILGSWQTTASQHCALRAKSTDSILGCIGLALSAGQWG